ncbi:MAG: hypothetical protein QGG36_25125 [Pirellulaceae bacterium]|jgi:hypothetical protein|nr:hypothetical protein [Pirellulaceae bacterium]MDP7019104.1 hypothetical protein [Pirellulaceae bacterium]
MDDKQPIMFAIMGFSWTMIIGQFFNSWSINAWTALIFFIGVVVAAAGFFAGKSMS